MKVISASPAVKFSLKVSPGLPRVLGDRMRLTQILMNLLTNAFKFTTRGSVVLAIREISREERHSILRFSVSDTGIGIETVQLERLFKPFEQGDDSSSRRFGGWGLGLAIGQRLAGLMGSEIKVESTPGKGSLFWLDVRLPLDTRAQRRPPLPVADPRPGHLRVLIADDNEINARLLSAMLTTKGYACTTVESGQKALVEALSGAFDVLLLDIDMPEMDGYEVAERLRASGNPASSEIRVIAITGNAFAEDVERALAAGIDSHLAKPVDFDALFQLLHDEEDDRGLSRAHGGAFA